MRKHSNKKQRVKLLLQNGNFREAKQLILNIMNEDLEGINNRDYKIIGELGDIDVCMELCEYNDALKYYQNSIDINPNNPSIYVKVGKLYHNYLTDYIKATEMY